MWKEMCLRHIQSYISCGKTYSSIDNDGKDGQKLIIQIPSGS